MKIIKNYLKRVVTGVRISTLSSVFLLVKKIFSRITKNFFLIFWSTEAERIFLTKIIRNECMQFSRALVVQSYFSSIF